MARIVTNECVLEAVKSYLNPSSFTEIIPVGHDTTFFAKRREGGVGSPVKVGYTTWKSEVGDEVSSLLGSDSGFEFRAIRKTAYWEELRELYHWARSEEHTSELQSRQYLVCRLLLEKKTLSPVRSCLFARH